MKPYFIGIGAYKSGTSWIHNCLYEHPEIFSPIKETYFFNNGANFPGNAERYEDFFRNCPAGARPGEFCPGYLSDSAVPLRIFAHYPTVRLIVSLRNPTDRAFSHYTADVCSGVIPATLSFRDAVISRPLYVREGLYAPSLRRYLSFFSRKKILILIYEDILADPERVMRSVYSFLGVDSYFSPSMLRVKVNASRVVRSVMMEHILISISLMLQWHGFHRLWWFIKRAGFGYFILRCNTACAASPLKISPEDKEFLKAYFDEDVRATESIIGRPLSGWR